MLLWFLTWFQFAHCQKDTINHDDEIKLICQEIQQYPGIEGSRLSSNAFPSEQWNKYEKLSALTTDSVLFSLTDHESPIIRGYAYFGLMDQNTTLLIHAIKNHLSDTVAVFYQYGCMGERTTVIDLAVEETYYNLVNENKKRLSQGDAEFITQLHRAIMYRRIDAYRNAKKKIAEQNAIQNQN